jgi:hypothetical protein
VHYRISLVTGTVNDDDLGGIEVDVCLLPGLCDETPMRIEPICQCWRRKNQRSHLVCYLIEHSPLSCR